MSRSPRALIWVALLLAAAVIPQVACAAWWNGEWQFRKRLTIDAPASAIALSAALFGLAFSVAFSALLYLGICLMLFALLTTGIGLLRGTRTGVG